jgi:hypothetical protein
MKNALLSMPALALAVLLHMPTAHAQSDIPGNIH